MEQQEIVIELANRMSQIVNRFAQHGTQRAEVWDVMAKIATISAAEAREACSKPASIRRGGTSLAATSASNARRSSASAPANAGNTAQEDQGAA